MNNFGIKSVLAAIALVPCFAIADVGGTPSFTAVRAQIENAGCDGCVVETVLDSSFAKAGLQPGAYAKARADFGDNGGYASVSPDGTEHAAFAESIWSDAFVVQGGSGQSAVDIRVRISGSLEGAVQAEGPGSNGFYTLFISAAPMSCNFDDVLCTGTIAIPLTVEISGTRYLQASVPFTYDKPFYLASYLGAEVWGGATGVADFFHSARFGISAPDGASLVTDSGTLYPAASSVPEPQSILMFLVGALFCIARGAQPSGANTFRHSKRPKLPA